MTDQKTSSSSSGIGFTGLLTVAFIVLKLVGYIAWGWWQVVAVIWIGYVLFGVLVVVGMFLSNRR